MKIELFQEDPDKWIYIFRKALKSVVNTGWIGEKCVFIFQDTLQHCRERNRSVSKFGLDCVRRVTKWESKTLSKKRFERVSKSGFAGEKE